MARQGELFGPAGLNPGGPAAPETMPLLSHQLQQWQERLAAHQQPLFNQLPSSVRQGSLFSSNAEEPEAMAGRFDPLSLQPQPLSFWRWPAAPQQGAALYLVTDRPAALPQPLLLYVGETGRADRRWKGEHDCKAYLAAYSEALLKAGLSCQLGIRFWLDVPAAVRPRRALEQALIRRWLPPFNKETRGRWATPFQADPS
jgi:hypothetical protein